MRIDLQDPGAAVWARHPDAIMWHSARKAPQLTSRCSAQVALGAPGTATLPMDTTQQFGPLCADCARLEGIGRAGGGS
jgi:hypothetical protein